MAKIACPECSSTSFLKECYNTCAGVSHYHDSDGVEHHHDPNTYVRSFVCGRGHRTSISSRPECPADGCPYGSQTSE